MPTNHVAATLAFAFASLIALGGHLTAATDPQPKKQTAAPAPASKSAAKATLASKKQAAKPAAKPTTKAAAKRTKAAKPTIKAAAKSPTRSLTVAAPRAGKTMPMPRPRPEANGAAPTLVLASADSQPALPRQSLAAPITTTTSANDIAAVRQALELIRKGQISALAEVKQTISDPAAVKLVDWCYLRSPYSNAGFDRYAAFTQANPSWPSVGMLQRRAEGALWEDKRDAATVRAYFASTEPKSGKGRLALARAFLAQGDQGNAQRYLREAWRRDAFTPDIEQQALDTFSGLLTTADHRARMHRMLFANDEGAAMRAARRLGPADIAVAKARLALTAKAENAGALLEAVPAEARNDPNYVFGRIQWLRRTDKIAEAGQLMLSMPNNPDALHDVDEWWVERRLLARKLLDIGDAQTAYRVARDAAPPEKENSRVEHEFTAGWIALRFLQQPKTALNHFARIPESTVHPTSLARAYYWQGRALEAMGRQNEARGLYQTAAQFSAAYYGQIARGRLGISEMTVRQPPQLSQTERAALRNVDIVRAVEILYAINERDLVTTMAADLGDRPIEVGVLTMIGEFAARNHDARSMLYLGRTALARGFPLEHFAFPDVGIPNVTPIGPDLDRAIVYAITRQESAFNQKTVSSANALGLMQVTPAAGRDTAKRFGAKFDQKRLLSDAVYNVQMGSAELAALLQDYRGSYILTFAGYNAGRGRIQEWVKRYGDPRNPQIDPIDWVELIPFSETRHYVQRVMENMAVYRVRLGGSNRLMIEADLRRGAAAN
ncbi:MAG TPA: lytic transglycosylase domain-containing protein [Xanthobacteraceae bacterium]|nr:lytic transglycosylase domain-containing protein [Xanthobacteraceae bacterium]